LVIAGLDPAFHLCLALGLITGRRRMRAGPVMMLKEPQ
jgi:hypothetical protein